MQPDTTPSSIEADALSREELITMAREADPFGDDGRLVSLAMLTPGTLERFAALVAAREREACAQVCRHAMQCAINKTDSQRILELTAQLAEAQKDEQRLDWIIEHRAYVVSDPDCCDGYWLNYARPDGTLWTQATEHETPRAAIDAAKGER